MGVALILLSLVHGPRRVSKGLDRKKDGKGSMGSQRKEEAKGRKRERGYFYRKGK